MQIAAAPRWVLRAPWLLPAATLLLCAAIGQLLVSRGYAASAAVHGLALAVITVLAWLWLVGASASTPVFLSLGAAGVLAWALAVTRAPFIAGDLAAMIAILALSAWQRRRRFQRMFRLSQELDDVAEEQVVKDQAIVQARQASEALQRKHARYTQLQAIAELLTGLTDLDRIAQLAVDSAFCLIGKSDVCLLFLVDKERQELALIASKRAPHIERVQEKHGDQFDRHVLRSHRPLLVTDSRRDFRFPATTGTTRPIMSVIACPLMADESAEGVLRLDSAHAAAYSQDDLRFLDILLDLVSTAITNARLFAQTQQLALTDGLTGLALRRPFMELLTREVTRAARNREPAAVLMLDVDHFKRFNDAYGHTAGDLVLKSVAQIMKSALPDDAVCARYGGEEFGVLLPKADRRTAVALAESIRSAVEQKAISVIRSSGKSVTVSIGAASFPDDAMTEIELIRIADQRLYRAKGAGRNRVCDA